MVLPLPDLDDRRWSDLVDEAQSLIHRYAPGWTDYNLSDPGITLLDLLAWIAEADLFGVNQVPARHRARFLALTSTALRPVVPARTPLGFTTSAQLPVTLPAGVLFAAATDDAAPVGHALLDTVDVLGCALTAVQVWTGTEFVDRTSDWRHGSAFDALGPDPTIGAALLLGLDPGPGLAKEARLSLWLGSADPVGAAPEEDTPSAHHGAHTVWEYHDGTGWRGFAGDVVDDTRALTRSGRVVVPLGEIDTASSAVGAITAPQRWLRVRLDRGRHDVAPRAGAVMADAAPVTQATPAWSTWRFANPYYVLPPEFVVGQSVRFGVRANSDGNILEFTAAGSDDPRALVLAVAQGSVTLTLIGAGIADGAPLFETIAPGAPFVGGGVEVWTADAGGATRWAVVDTLLRSGADDPHVVVDASAGILMFGDGQYGRIPAAGSVVLIRADQSAGTAGTPTPRTRWQLDTADPVTAALTAGKPIAAGTLGVRAGADPDAARAPDDLETGEGRAADAVWTHERVLALVPPGTDATLDQLDRTRILARSRPPRAATAVDFERLALEVPGTAVLRVRAWAGFDPMLPGQAAPGTVTLVVVPGLPAQRPTPTAALLTAIRRYLCPRRTLGTRLVVTGPDYVQVSARAVVRALAHADVQRVRADAEARLYAYLHPLTGGPQGCGWPFGRDVYESDLLRQLDLIGGVDHIEEIALTADGVPTGCGNICVGSASLVVSGTHEVTVR